MTYQVPSLLVLWNPDHSPVGLGESPFLNFTSEEVESKENKKLVHGSLSQEE